MNTRTRKETVKTGVNTIDYSVFKRFETYINQLSGYFTENNRIRLLHYNGYYFIFKIAINLQILRNLRRKQPLMEPDAIEGHVGNHCR